MLVKSFGWCENYAGPAGPPSGDLDYCDGLGRRTHYKFVKWEGRRVIKWWLGQEQKFRAIVSTYQQNVGERWQIKRYAVFEGDAGWGDPIFYVLRHHDGARIVFNCHGHIIAWLDRHLNTMRFSYGAPYNPQTNYKVLRQIKDTTGRPYRLGYTFVGGFPKIETWIDKWDRTVTFKYNPNGELSDVLAPAGQHSEHRLQYRYSGRAGLLSEAVAAREASGTTRQSYLDNTYDGNERVILQRYGTPAGMNPKAGGETEFIYTGDTVSSVKDRRGETTEYEFKPLHQTFVMKKRKVINRRRSIPNVTFTEPPSYTWEVEYDNDFRVVSMKKPRGGEENYRYVTRNAPLYRVGEERDWVEQDITWDNDLAAGNMLERVVTSHRVRDGSRTFAWTFERLFNEPLTATTPVGVTQYTYENQTPWHTLEKNGMPTEVKRPNAPAAGGAVVTVIEKMSYRRGGLLKSQTDPDNVVTSFEYDDNGALKETTRGIGKVGGPPPGARSGANNRLLSDVRYDVDSEGRSYQIDTLDFDILSTSSSTRMITTSEIRSPGVRLKTQIDGAGRETKHSYDSAGRLVRTDRPGGHFTAFTLSRTGQALGEQRFGQVEGSGVSRAPVPLNINITRTYDDMDRVQTETIPGSGTTKYAYDSQGNVRAVLQPSGAIQQFKYDTMGRRTQTLLPQRTNSDLVTLKIKYDANGSPIEKTDGLQHKTKLTYDALDRLIKTEDPDGRTERIEYDKENRPVLHVSRARRSAYCV